MPFRQHDAFAIFSTRVAGIKGGEASHQRIARTFAPFSFGKQG
jgi:hypothetical protein